MTGAADWGKQVYGAAGQQTMGANGAIATKMPIQAGGRKQSRRGGRRDRQSRRGGRRRNRSVKRR